MRRLVWILPLLAAVIAAWFLNRNRERVRRWLAPCCILVIAVCAALVVPKLIRVPGMTVTALDVGQGQCLVIRSGTATAVVDCGSSSVDDPEERLVNWLRSAGVTQVDLLVLTHYHSDHCSGVPGLLMKMPVRSAVLPPPDDEVTWDESIRRLADENGCSVYTVGDTAVGLSFGEASARVWPPLAVEGENERCLAVLFSQGSFDALVTGDMPASGEQMLVSLKELPDTEVLIAGHHGSAFSSCDEFLDAVTPEIVLISVGANEYGHPADVTLRRLARHGAEVLRTDELGSITVTSDMEVR
ncbi:MAG: MBL fold metallo-hydrolase [Oscillospiraceae bacterium]|nr:MBL fold metallo-hydrolase [Oscillospiraceae bacterium]